MNACIGRKPVWVAADRSLGRFSVFCRDGANGRERDERPSETVVDGANDRLKRWLTVPFTAASAVGYEQEVTEETEVSFSVFVLFVCRVKLVSVAG